MNSLSVTWDVIRLRGDPEDASWAPCPDCHHALDLHQPNKRWPDRLVGTCDECETWFFIHASAGLIVRLPDEAELRDA